MNKSQEGQRISEGGRCIFKEGVQLLDSKYGVHRLPLVSKTEQRLGRT